MRWQEAGLRNCDFGDRVRWIYRGYRDLFAVRLFCLFWFTSSQIQYRARYVLPHAIALKIYYEDALAFSSCVLAALRHRVRFPISADVLSNPPQNYSFVTGDLLFVEPGTCTSYVSQFCNDVSDTILNMAVRTIDRDLCILFV
jgi:hypothetical protein